MSEASEKLEGACKEFEARAAALNIPAEQILGLHGRMYHAARALLAERTWRPIEEAPHEGPGVLLWWSARFAIPINGHWGRVIEGWRAWHDPLDGRVFKGPPPTHWMPLPPPPEPKT